MLNNTTQQSKKAHEAELSDIKPILTKLGFSLDENQPHISGERHLMQAVTTTSGSKLILLGTRVSDKRRVVIKATKDPDGVREIKHERVCRDATKNIIFAYDIFYSPEEILSTKKDGYTISIQLYIDQPSAFLDRPTKEQFFLALKALKTQEGAHATTYRHMKAVSKTFGIVDTDWYISSYKTFQKNTKGCLPKDNHLHLLLKRGLERLGEERDIIEQYNNFLTHTDFVPHNFRVNDGKIYLLDYSSLRFGNKYESWARFLNFMTLYNRPLEEALLFYVKNNRTKEEYRSLELMRIYRLGEIIWFYTNLLNKTSGDLHALTEKRVDFWASVL